MWSLWGRVQPQTFKGLAHRSPPRLLPVSSPCPPHSAAQSPAIQTRNPAWRRMKTTPCPFRQRPRPPATSRPLPSPRRALHPAACLPSPPSGAWRRCPSLFPRYKVGRSARQHTDTDCLIGNKYQSCTCFHFYPSSSSQAVRSSPLSSCHRRLMDRRCCC